MHADMNEEIAHLPGFLGLSPYQVAESAMQLPGNAGDFRSLVAWMVLGTKNGGTSATVIHHLLMAK